MPHRLRIARKGINRVRKVLEAQFCDLIRGLRLLKSGVIAIDTIETRHTEAFIANALVC